MKPFRSCNCWEFLWGITGTAYCGILLCALSAYPSKVEENICTMSEISTLATMINALIFTCGYWAYARYFKTSPIGDRRINKSAYILPVTAYITSLLVVLEQFLTITTFAYGLARTLQFILMLITNSVLIVTWAWRPSYIWSATNLQRASSYERVDSKTSASIEIPYEDKAPDLELGAEDENNQSSSVIAKQIDGLELQHSPPQQQRNTSNSIVLTKLEEFQEVVMRPT